MQAEYICNDGMVRFVGSWRLETAKESQILSLCRQPELFRKFPDQRRFRRLLRFHLAASCMKEAVPRLRTSNVFPSARNTRAAAMRIVFIMS